MCKRLYDVCWRLSQGHKPIHKTKASGIAISTYAGLATLLTGICIWKLPYDDRNGYSWTKGFLLCEGRPPNSLPLGPVVVLHPAALYATIDSGVVTLTEEPHPQTSMLVSYSKRTDRHGVLAPLFSHTREGIDVVDWHTGGTVGENDAADVRLQYIQEMQNKYFAGRQLKEFDGPIIRSREFLLMGALHNALILGLLSVALWFTRCSVSLFMGRCIDRT